jgi:hypothetical protein
MSTRSIYSVLVVLAILFVGLLVADSNDKNEAYPEQVKIAMRDVGDQLLIINQDSTSLVLPIVQVDRSKYRLSFQNQLSIMPNSLVSIVDKGLRKAGLPKDYIVEVIQCADQEVSYSYVIRAEEAKTIIPCSDRLLEAGCYTVEVSFIDISVFFLGKRILLYSIVLITVILLGLLFYKRKQEVLREKSSSTYAAIGSFRFYPEQNKLVKEAVETSLSKKECELLTIFVANSNQIIKRDELMKKVWEDNGVIVGRSLDTYISKLRKKLQEDDSIKLTNIHGVGYKLEIDN